MIVAFMAVMIRIRLMMSGIVGVGVFGVLVVVMLLIVRLGVLRRIGAFRVDDLALHPLAIAAAARIAMPRTAVAARTVFGFFFRLAMGALVGFDQRLPVGDRNLIVIGVDFAEGQKAMAIAADHDHPGLFRMGGIDQHLVGHFGTLDGGGRAGRQALVALPGGATVHLIRG